MTASDAHKFYYDWTHIKIPKHENNRTGWVNEFSTAFAIIATADVIDAPPWSMPVCVVQDRKFPVVQFKGAVFEKEN